jgi:hypothetical protein
MPTEGYDNPHDYHYINGQETRSGENYRLDMSNRLYGNKASGRSIDLPDGEQRIGLIGWWLLLLILGVAVQTSGPSWKNPFMSVWQYVFIGLSVIIGLVIAAKLWRLVLLVGVVVIGYLWWKPAPAVSVPVAAAHPVKPRHPTPK